MFFGESGGIGGNRAEDVRIPYPFLCAFFDWLCCDEFFDSDGHVSLTTIIPAVHKLTGHCDGVTVAIVRKGLTLMMLLAPKRGFDVAMWEVLAVKRAKMCHVRQSLDSLPPEHCAPAAAFIDSSFSMILQP